MAYQTLIFWIDTDHETKEPFIRIKDYAATKELSEREGREIQVLRNAYVTTYPDGTSRLFMRNPIPNPYPPDPNPTTIN